MPLSKDFEFICILGWDEKLYQESLSWVEDGRRVAFVADQEQQSADPRVAVHVMESPLQEEMIAKKIGWASVFKKLQVIGSGPLKEKIEECHTAAHALLSEASDYWVKPMRNARLNNGFYRRGLELQGAFTGIPAVIVGAGPSLEKNGHLLRRLREKALLFAGGTALNAIDVEPHFAASIDAEAPYRQFKGHPFSEVPFCYQSRMNPDNFGLIHGEKILFPDSACDAINWIHEEERFDSGWTVGNFLTQAAILMGCSPIFFVGMDLCYQGRRKYAKIDADAPDGLIQVGDVWTQKDWLLAARWTEARNVPMFDASDGILSLPKVKLNELSLPEIGEINVHEAIQKLQLKKATRWDEWAASLRTCKKKIEQIEHEIVYQKLLLPLWQIWRPVFEREAPGQNLEIHRKLFFQNVLEEHEEFVLSER
ncbi:MAG: DUF115 domain-containing protein [Parachlamydiales bacterium]|nr:DUF115 domain-containing protein [Parachlamydiales bacterium]